MTIMIPAPRHHPAGHVHTRNPRYSARDFSPIRISARLSYGLVRDGPHERAEIYGDGRGGGEVRPAREDANVEHEPEGDGREGCPALECRVDNVEWSY